MSLLISQTNYLDQIILQKDETIKSLKLLNLQHGESEKPIEPDTPFNEVISKMKQLDN